MTAGLAHRELISWIRLARSGGVGTKTFRAVLKRFATASEAIEHLGDLGLRRGITPLPAAEAEREHAAAVRAGLRYVTWADKEYPAPLKAIEDAPPLLLVRGQVDVLGLPMVGVVGARNATVNGRKMARILARDLAAAGVCVISGLARGVDGAAHEGALEAPGGKTVAVLAGGTDVIYPPEHEKLHARIAETGAVISEMPPGTEPQAALFPRRNRIISGASVGVVVVEATLRSGSLITARIAADQGRDVFAVPGSPLDPRAAGPNTLIRDGATLVQSVDDILSEIPVKSVSASEIYLSNPNAPQDIETKAEIDQGTLRSEIEQVLSTAPLAVDELVRQCQVSAAVVATVLMELEVAGRIERLPGNRVALIGTV